MIELAGPNLRRKYLNPGKSKKGKANQSGNSGASQKKGMLPVGIPRRYRGKTRYA